MATVDLRYLLPDDRPICGYATKCTRLNPDHLRWKKHDHIEKLFISIVDSPHRRDAIIASQIDLIIQQVGILESLHSSIPRPEMDQRQRSSLSGIFSKFFGGQPSVVTGINVSRAHSALSFGNPSSAAPVASQSVFQKVVAPVSAPIKAETSEKSALKQTKDETTTQTNILKSKDENSARKIAPLKQGMDLVRPAQLQQPRSQANLNSDELLQRTVERIVIGPSVSLKASESKSKDVPKKVPTSGISSTDSSRIQALGNSTQTTSLKPSAISNLRAASAQKDALQKTENDSLIAKQCRTSILKEQSTHLHLTKTESVLAVSQEVSKVPPNFLKFSPPESLNDSTRDLKKKEVLNSSTLNQQRTNRPKVEEYISTEIWRGNEAATWQVDNSIAAMSSVVEGFSSLSEASHEAMKKSRQQKFSSNGPNMTKNPTFIPTESSNERYLAKTRSERKEFKSGPETRGNRVNPRSLHRERAKVFFIEDGIVHLHPFTSGDFVRQQFINTGLMEGTLFSVNIERTFGLIKVANESKRFSFVFSNVVSLCEEEVILQRGMKLRFSVDKKNSQRAYKVYIDNAPASRKSKGVVVSVADDVYILESNVEVHRKKLPEFCLPVRCGDLVEYDLAQAQGNPSARVAKLIQLSERSSKDILLFFQQSTEHFKTALVDQVLDDILSAPILWRYLSDFVFVKAKYVFYFLDFLDQTIEASFERKQRKLVETLNNLFDTDLFTDKITNTECLSAFSTLHWEKKFQGVSDVEDRKSGIEIVVKLMTNILEKVPEVFYQLKSVVESLLKATTSSMSGHVNISCLFSSIVKAGGMETSNAKQSYKTLGRIPNSQELAGSPMELDQSLPIVQVSDPYLTPADYMDTYYRLLRAEVYSAIQSGIKALKSNKLDDRDMYSYLEVCLVGHLVQKMQISLALKFRPKRKVANWAISRQLMFGNLLCISPSGNFNDLIWVTVAERDEVLLKKSSIILVELCKENTMSLSDIFNCLNSCGGQAVMVESPTYFQAFNPVMSTLQRMDLGKYSLKDDIVFAVPSILEASQQVNLEDPEIETIWQNLDRYQFEAFSHALKHSLAIIQGPPGTGKTFVGVKLIEAKLKIGCPTPILILSYKNHALDEFLKHLYKKGVVGLDDIVRVGGRSSEPDLAGCNLNQLLRSRGLIDDVLSEVYREIDEAKSEFDTAVVEMHRKSGISIDELFGSLLKDQVLSLIPKARGPDNNKWLREISEACTKKSGYFEALMSHDSLSSNEQKFLNTAIVALKNWLPNRKNLQEMRKLQAKLLVKKQDPTDDSDQTGNDLDLDEEEVKQELEARMACAGSGRGDDKSRAGQNMVLLDITKQNKDCFRISDFPIGMEPDYSVLESKDMPNLDESERIQFVHAKIFENLTPLKERFNQLTTELEFLLEKKKNLEEEKKMEILKQKKIIGMTITGGATNSSLLQKLGPKVVLVEEAAEILEPCLISAISRSTRHLILIGDHKQLRPNVDTYKLRINCKFDVSMMERLIGTKFPYKTLNIQSRMRPEFSIMLRDIYPDYQDNLAIVQRNETADCLAKSMFFWSHDHPEGNPKEKEASRSKVNHGEADMVIALALFLLGQGVDHKDITILGAYLGQTKILKQKLKEAKAKYSDLFDTDDETVAVQTIDLFQGDENKYVIISLVRSHVNKIGFLEDKNRRCVAQSRSKCGMYFIGNAQTIRQSDTWNPLITHMDQENCLGKEIEAQCPQHPKLSRHLFSDASSIIGMLDKPNSFCQVKCGEWLPCGKPEHCCDKTCFPKHSHYKCLKPVNDKFPDCRHIVERKCFEDIEDLDCQVDVQVRLNECQHWMKKKCYQSDSEISCTNKCRSLMDCKTHMCTDICGNSHGHSICDVLIDFQFPVCQHPSPTRKKCSLPVTWKCKKLEKVTLLCSHPNKKKCYEKINEVICPRPCIRTRKCQHPCQDKCGADCEAQNCFKIVDLLKDGISTAAKYLTVEDKVMKYIQPVHNWYPRVTKIEEIINPMLELKFERAKLKCSDNYIDQKFHGTQDIGIQNIPKEGFRRPKPLAQGARPSMYGQGIYFATDSSKSAQDIYTGGSNKLLLCDVLLGKSKTVHSADTKLSLKKIRDEGFDSVFAPRNSKATGGVLNDEFVIYDPDQAIPRYIIHFTNSRTVSGPAPLRSVVAGQPFVVREMQAARVIDTTCPFEACYARASGYFHQMHSKQAGVKYNIKSIKVVYNRVLEDAFLAKKQEFKRLGIKDDEIFAFHGTAIENVDKILKENLQLKYARRQAYGPGNYFSEFPDISLGYGQGLILFRVLPGVEYSDNSVSDIPQGCNSKKVNENADGFGAMLIIKDSSQFLPYAQYKLERTA